MDARGAKSEEGRRSVTDSRARRVAFALTFGLAFTLAWLSPSGARAERRMHDKDETEVGFFPVVGGTSDVGLGVGFLGALAHYRKGQDTYTWRVEAGAFLAYKPRGGHTDFAYQDYYTVITVPELTPRVRLSIRPSFTREATQNYYGIGNASKVPTGPVNPDFNQYGRVHPTLAARLRFTLAPNLFFVAGNYFTFNEIAVYSPSKLSEDIHSPNLLVRSIVGDPKTHAVDFVETAFLYDSRDDETEPHYGMFHKLQLRLSPGGNSVFPYRYEQVNATACFYVSPVHSFTFAARLVGDVLFDDPPFYELARYDDTFALGGVKGVRGVPGQRYYGKVKAFGNLEGRLRLAAFHLFGKRLRFGVAGFFDAGRAWTDFQSNPDLDGTSLGLKWGAGGGLRLYEASTFAIRFDVAYSPDAHPIGGYLGVGEIF